jgi:hypothetical protein
LLLEGDDLEALLLRAHAEAGANARIVRAERVRRGGVLGFFARPTFEVAVEIPDSTDSPASPDAPESADAPPRPALGVESVLPAHRGGRSWTASLRSSSGGRPGADPAMAIAETRVDPEPQTGTPFRPGIVDSSGRDIVAVPAPASSPATDLPAATHPAPAPAVEPVMPIPTPAAPAADQPDPAPPDGSDDEFTAWLETAGVLGMADRSPAERAAARVITLQPEDYRVNPDPVTPLSPPDVLPVSEGHPPIFPLPGEGVHWTHEPHDDAEPKAAEPKAAEPKAAEPKAAEPKAAEPQAAEPKPVAGAPEVTSEDPVLLGRTAQVGGTTIIPQERVAPHRLPTERATLGALFEQLRAGVRRPRHRRDAPADAPLPAQAEAPDVAEGFGAGPSPTLPRVQGPIEPTVVSAVPSGRAQTITRTGKPAPRAAAGGAFPVPAPRTSTEIEAPAEPERRRTPRHVDARLTADRRALRALGVPGPWTRRLRGGDRFPAVLAILDRMPEVDIDPDAAVVAVVGPPGVVVLEAHRTALDLPVGHDPRPVVTIGVEEGPQREQAVTAARGTRPVVIAVEVADYGDTDAVRSLIRSVQAEAVIAVVDARRKLEDTTRWLEALERVDALAVDGGLEVPDPAAALHLELPVIRLDGIPLDRFGWTALLCAWLQARGT